MEHAGVFFDDFAARFDSLYDGKRNPFMRWVDRTFRSDMFIRYEKTFELLGDLTGKSVLDIGCGSGPYLLEALRRGAAHVTGLDPAPSMLALAKNRLTLKGLQDRATLVTGYFPEAAPGQESDCAIVMGVMDYVADAPTFLARVKSVVRTGAAVSFPSDHWLRGPLRHVRYRLRNVPLFLYTPERIDEVMRQAGVTSYKVEKIPGAGMDYMVWVGR
jgi:cyclopropane fatty-acyl-phospholipid synthase-like methyltransferase